jgi:hypothetical protein
LEGGLVTLFIFCGGIICINFNCFVVEIRPLVVEMKMGIKYNSNISVALTKCRFKKSKFKNHQEIHVQSLQIIEMRSRK